MKDRPLVLIVDDDDSTRDILAEFFRLEGFETDVATSTLGLRDRLSRSRASVLVLDAELPYRSGVSFLTELASDPRTASLPVVLLTEAPDTLTAARRARARAVLEKPLDLDQLAASVRDALGVASTTRRRVASGATRVTRAAK